ncbi:MAG: YjhG/YagF family D-xylonate dehydratase, partial [bacterium]
MSQWIEAENPADYQVYSSAAGPEGKLPLSEDMLRHWPSGDLFGLSQNTGMGWNPELAAADPFLILSTQGGLRAEDGRPIALGYHTGHWEIGLLVKAAAVRMQELGKLPFAG